MAGGSASEKERWGTGARGRGGEPKSVLERLHVYCTSTLYPTKLVCCTNQHFSASPGHATPVRTRRTPGLASLCRRLEYPLPIMCRSRLYSPALLRCFIISVVSEWVSG
eukprot:COSAG03_NODE_858_length_5603_cov_3.620276_1_plen_109_part_00